jgi:hypothetical protein
LRSGKVRRYRDRPVYVEFPDFGFGPAAAALTLINGLEDPPEWHLVSSGSAAEFARLHLPDAFHHELDTFDPACWERFPGLRAPGSLIISLTNPEFAGWAAREGCAVGVVDTLDWMWPVLPAGVEETCLHMTQAYFHNDAMTRLPSPSARVVRPIVDPRLWRSQRPTPAPGTAVIGFGGMHLPVPFGDELVATYTRWFLAQALPLLVNEAEMSTITIVGGRSDLSSLVPEEWSQHRAIEVRPRLSRSEYSRLLRSAEHLLLSPGLGSLYECSTSGLAPLLQPGWNMSMLLQAFHVSELLYEHMCRWEWLEEAVGDVKGKPEGEGLALLVRRIRETIHEDQAASESFLLKPIRTYLERGEGSAPLRLPLPMALPSAVDLLNDHLERSPGPAR